MNTLKVLGVDDPRRACGFTVVELLVVTAVIAVLAGILLPVLAKGKSRAEAVFCMNNTRQLTLAWMMYADDESGRLAYNLGTGGWMGDPTPMSLNWANNVLDWDLSPDNTNDVKLVETGLGPYTAKAARVYRCPSDHLLSCFQSGAGWRSRVRSYSMNAMVGDAGGFSQGGNNVNNPDYTQFFKVSAIPQPSGIFVFLDEHPDSIGDGYFVNRAYYPEWVRLPASYHDRGACFSFADGHSETHRWSSGLTTPASLPYQAHLPILIPANDRADFDWVISRMSIEQPGVSDSAD